jgi:hypothetical protein
MEKFRIWGLFFVAKCLLIGNKSRQRRAALEDTVPENYQFQVFVREVVSDGKEEEGTFGSGQ